MKAPFQLAILAVLSMVLIGCEESTGTVPLNIPDTYPGENFSQNAEAQLQLVDQSAALTALMKEGRSGTAVPHADLLTAVNPLRPHVTPSFQSVMDVYLLRLAQASGGSTYDPMKAPGENGSGGVYGGYLFDENGIEMEQLVEKGLFGAMSYNHAVQIMKNSNLTHKELEFFMICTAWL